MSSRERPRVPIVVNPVAGGGRALRWRHAVEAGAAAAGVEAEWWPTSGRGHAEELAAGAARQGRPLLLACGGDGTYNEVARGLLGSLTAMGVLAAGTTSVLAYELGIPRRAERAVPALLAAPNRVLHVGRSNRGDIFLLMLSAGADTTVLDRLRPGLKRLGGRWGVAAQAVLELCGRRPLPRVRASFDGGQVDGGWVIVGKARCYGGRYHATPGADPFRPSLELIVQRAVGRRPALAFALGIPFEIHVRRRDVVRAAVGRVTIESAKPSVRVRYQVDGDLAGELPVEAWVASETLLVRVPLTPMP